MLTRLRKSPMSLFSRQRMALPHNGKSETWVLLWRGAMPCEGLLPQTVTHGSVDTES